MDLDSFAVSVVSLRSPVALLLSAWPPVLYPPLSSSKFAVLAFWFGLDDWFGHKSKTLSFSSLHSE